MLVNTQALSKLWFISNFFYFPNWMLSEYGWMTTEMFNDILMARWIKTFEHCFRF